MEMKKIFYLLSAVLFCCLVLFLFFQEEKITTSQSTHPQKEESTPAPINEKFIAIKFLEVSDTVAIEAFDVNGEKLISGELYLQSKINGQLLPLSHSSKVYEQIDYYLCIDNKEKIDIKIQNFDSTFTFVDGIVFFHGDKEIIKDSLGQYQLVLN